MKIDEATAARAVKANQALRAALVRAKATQALAGAKLKTGALDAALKDALEVLDVDDKGELVPRADASEIVNPEHLEKYLRRSSPYLFTDGGEAVAGVRGGKKQTIAWNDTKAISENIEKIAAGEVAVKGELTTS